MAKPNYSFEKRQRDLAKKKKKEEKLLKRPRPRMSVPRTNSPRQQPGKQHPSKAARRPSAGRAVQVAHRLRTGGCA